MNKNLLQMLTGSNAENSLCRKCLVKFFVVFWEKVITQKAAGIVTQRITRGVSCTTNVSKFRFVVEPACSPSRPNCRTCLKNFQGCLNLLFILKKWSSYCKLVILCLLVVWGEGIVFVICPIALSKCVKSFLWVTTRPISHFVLQPCLIDDGVPVTKRNRTVFPRISIA